MSEATSPLAAALDRLARRPPDWIPEQALAAFARHCLGVPADRARQWYGWARWGHFAQKLLIAALTGGRSRDVAGLVEEIDWQPLRALLERKKGVILASSHIGPWQPVIQLAADSGLPVVAISGARRWQPGNTISVSDHNGIKTALAKALLHLRRNGVILVAPDGRWGSRERVAELLGQRVKLFSGVGELAQLSGAPTCVCHATWTRIDRIRIGVGTQISPQGAGDAWLDGWYSGYLDLVSRQMRSRPADLGFIFGLWNTSRGGLRWRNFSPGST